MKYVEQNKQNTKLSEVLMIIFLILVCLVMFIGSVYYLGRQQNNKNTITLSTANSMIDVVFDDVSHVVSSIKQSMLLISKIPVMREFESNAFFEELVSKYKIKAHLIIETYTPFIGFAYMQYKKNYNAMIYWREIYTATIRRIYMVVGIGNDEQLNESQIICNQATINRFVEQTNIASTFASKFSMQLDTVFDKVDSFAYYLDVISGLKRKNIVDRKGAENLMITSLINQKYIHSMSIKTLDGVYQAGVSEFNSFSKLATTQLRSRRFLRPFVSGPVTFNEKIAKPLWNVFVPIRDRCRETIAYISSLVDLSFLERLSSICSSNKGCSLFFVDEDGTVIGHTNKSMVINQINLKYSNFAVKKAIAGKLISEISHINGRDYIVACRPLHQFEAIDNPKWAIIFIARVDKFAGRGGKIFSFSLIVLAVLSMYVLFYLSRHLVNLIVEGNENNV